MRLIGFLSNEKQAKNFSLLLDQYGIANEVEASRNFDWGNSDYGSVQFKIWVIDEDQLDQAVQVFEEFQHDPDNPKYNPSQNITEPLPPNEKEIYIQQGKQAFPINNLMIWACCILYFLSSFNQPTEFVMTAEALWSPLYSSPVRQVLMFDYPRKYELLNDLLDRYGIRALTEPSSLNEKGKALFKEFINTDYWRGIYGNIVHHREDPGTPIFTATPMFEKIRKGEVWRAITPIFLHADLLHLFFNMIWLFALGRQVAFNLGVGRYLLFVTLSAVFSNTCQYLMTGSNFLGYSGVLCAMLSFIWMRQRRAPWEKYLLQRPTFVFMTFFIFFMAGIQLLSFITEVLFTIDFSPAIANTAHISGFFMGLLLGKYNYFAAKT